MREALGFVATLTTPEGVIWILVAIVALALGITLVTLILRKP